MRWPIRLELSLPTSQPFAYSQIEGSSSIACNWHSGIQAAVGDAWVLGQSGGKAESLPQEAILVESLQRDDPGRRQGRHDNARVCQQGNAGLSEPGRLIIARSIVN